MHVTRKVSSVLTALAVATSFAVAPLVMAKNDHAQTTFVPNPIHNNVSINIGQNGNVEVHGATVTAKNSSGFIATTLWGSTSLTWTVRMASSTHLKDKKDKGEDKRTDALADISVGDTVDWNGQLDTTATALTVNARVVNDRSKVGVSASHAKDIFQGILQSAASTSTALTTLSLKIGGALSTVNVTSGTSIINASFAPTTLATFQTGDVVRVYGSLNASSTIDALIVRDASR